MTSRVVRRLETLAAVVLITPLAACQTTAPDTLLASKSSESSRSISASDRPDLATIVGGDKDVRLRVQRSRPRPGQKVDEFRQPQSVVDRYFPDPPVRFDTPAFTYQTAFTSQRDLLDYIDRLRKRSDRLVVRNLGFSQEGRRIPMLVFTTGQGGSPKDLVETGKPTVWIHAQLHGNEPAAGEGALALANELTGALAYVLERINIVIVPRVNVDGSAYFERRASNDRDLNRDSLRLDVKESIALRQASIRYAPAVTVDAHEYYAVRDAMSAVTGRSQLESHDLLIQGAENPNVPERVRALTNNLFIRNATRDVRESGLRVHEYYFVTVHQAEEAGGIGALELNSGSTAARIGRNFHGLLNQVSILLETRGIGIGRQSFRRRVYTQLVAMQSIVETAYRQAELLERTIALAKAEVISLGAVTGDKDRIVLQSRRTEFPNYEVPYIDAVSGRKLLLPVRYRRYDPLIPVFSRERPFAYILTPAASRAKERLAAFGVQILPFDQAKRLPVQAFRVTTASSDRRPYEGVRRRRARVTIEPIEVAVPPGSHIVYMSQPLGNLIAELLEPEGGDSFVTFGILNATENELLPVYRYMDPLGI
ncbi:MAG: M14 family zinc carboxypeptidase [Burkholderiaceae bacterium]